MKKNFNELFELKENDTTIVPKENVKFLDLEFTQGKEITKELGKMAETGNIVFCLFNFIGSNFEVFEMNNVFTIEGIDGIPFKKKEGGFVDELVDRIKGDGNMLKDKLAAMSEDEQDQYLIDTVNTKTSEVKTIIEKINDSDLTLVINEQYLKYFNAEEIISERKEPGYDFYDDNDIFWTINVLIDELQKGKEYHEEYKRKWLQSVKNRIKVNEIEEEIDELRNILEKKESNNNNSSSSSSSDNGGGILDMIASSIPFLSFLKQKAETKTAEPKSEDNNSENENTEETDVNKMSISQIENKIEELEDLKRKYD